MPAPRVWVFPNKKDAVAMASLLRAKRPTFNFVANRPKWCRAWRIAIIDTHTGQQTGWVTA